MLLPGLFDMIPVENGSIVIPVEDRSIGTMCT
jgi:hypothetical protein